MLKYILLTTISIFLSLFFGVFCFVRASRIVEFYRNHYSSYRLLRSGLMFPFRAWWESEYAEALVRIIGVCMMLMAAFLAFVMIRGLLQ
jgi:hypothetical protein